jgi:poly(A) polymerase
MVREEHPQARFVVETLHRAGFIAYYAGGWVRDFLLGYPSDDIDIATNAPPETIQALFSHTVPIGIAFGIILVIIEDHQIEVATFRRDLAYQDGRRPTQIEFAKPEEDARRRDFTINGMFYDPIKGEVLDYVGGQKDLQLGIVRAIGNPHERIKEDRLRMIRAIRMACRFGFEIELKTASAIRTHAKELFPAVAIERIMQEFGKGKLFLSKMLLLLHQFDLLTPLFPELSSLTQEEMQRRLEPLAHYPQAAPLITFLLPLFPQYSLEEQLALCKRLKCSNQDMRFVAFLHHARTFLQTSQPSEPVQWAHFYAHPASTFCLQIIGENLKEHEQHQCALRQAIDRVHTPVVTGDHLKREGIISGKIMGILLTEAERISLNENLYDPALVIEKLKQSPLWPREKS